MKSRTRKITQAARKKRLARYFFDEVLSVTGEVRVISIQAVHL